jgi:hypothetical protein
MERRSSKIIESGQSRRSGAYSKITTKSLVV